MCTTMHKSPTLRISINCSELAGIVCAIHIYTMELLLLRQCLLFKHHILPYPCAKQSVAQAFRDNSAKAIHHCCAYVHTVARTFAYLRVFLSLCTGFVCYTSQSLPNICFRAHNKGITTAISTVLHHFYLFFEPQK